MSAPFGTGAYLAVRRTSTGAIDAASHKILNVTDGSDSGDAVNKGQLDAAISGVSVPSVETVVDLTGTATATAGLFTTNFIDASGGAVSITLPAAAAGKVVKFTVINATNAISIAAGSGDTLSTNVPTALYVVDETLKLVAKDATTWYIGC